MLRETVNLDFLPEPELEFGQKARHIDIRFGLSLYGPHDLDRANRPQEIRVGIVGTPENVEKLTAWLERCRHEIPAKKSKQPNLFPSFPGFAEDVAFRSKLTLNPGLCRQIQASAFDELASASHNVAISESVALFLAEFSALLEKRTVDVLVCAVPPQLVALREPDVAESKGVGVRFDFHHMLKAKAMRTRVPVQLVLPETYDHSLSRRQKIRSTKLRTRQDEATRAWNLHTALYYKANGIPWRLVPDEEAFTTCFVGISFYKTLDQVRVMTSMAQVFNERGHGIIVRGEPVRLRKDDRIPHLDEAGAEKLLMHALDQYRLEHGNLPARVVLHKTSNFDDAEVSGFLRAAKSNRISQVDSVSVTDGFPVRLFRLGAYPPLRGSMMTLDARNHLIYLRGSVDFFQTYPGQYIPRPFVFRCDKTQQTPTFLAREMLALSKMNWNDTQFDGGSPITVAAARKVSGILKYAGADDVIAHRYSHYM
jgi:hypothetical protein